MIMRRSFHYTDENGETIDYSIIRVNTTYNIKKETKTEMIRVFEMPSIEHPAWS